MANKKPKKRISTKLQDRLEQDENFILKIGGELGDLCRIAKKAIDKGKRTRLEVNRLVKAIGELTVRVAKLESLLGDTQKNVCQ